jgi:hypothetical protein
MQSAKARALKDIYSAQMSSVRSGLKQYSIVEVSIAIWMKSDVIRLVFEIMSSSGRNHDVLWHSQQLVSASFIQRTTTLRSTGRFMALLM